MWSRSKLGTQFTLLLLIVFLVGSAIAGGALSRVLQSRAEAQVAAEGYLLMNSIRAARYYTDLQVRPVLEAQLGSDDFLPEIVPAYAARRTFEEIQASDDRYQAHTYKEAVWNPTNPNDQADEFETSLIQAFEASESASESVPELFGFRTLPDRGRVFYTARPMRLENPSCLQCHSTPEAAPSGMLAIYGRENGFGWELNKIFGVQVVYAPAEEVFSASRRAFGIVMGLFFAVFAIALLALNGLLQPFVVKPIRQLARLSQRLAADEIQSPQDLDAPESEVLTKVSDRKDELGQLGRMFQDMLNEVLARQQRLRQQIRALKIEIDEQRKAREVEEIVETDYFQDLQKKAKQLRDRKQTDPD